MLNSKLKEWEEKLLGVSLGASEGEFQKEELRESIWQFKILNNLFLVLMTIRYIMLYIGLVKAVGLAVGLHVNMLWGLIVLILFEFLIPKNQDEWGQNVRRIYLILVVPNLAANIFMIFVVVEASDICFPLHIVHIIVNLKLVAFCTFILRKLFITILIYITLYTAQCIQYIWSHKECESAIAIWFNLVIVVLATWMTIIFTKFCKLNFKHTNDIKTKEKLYETFINKLQSAVIFYSKEKGVTFMNKIAKEGNLQIQTETFTEFMKTKIFMNTPEQEKQSLFEFISENESRMRLEGEIKEYFSYKEERNRRILIISVMEGEFYANEESLAIVIRDITIERQLIEEKLSNKHKTQILSSVSHELRTPLNGLSGMLSDLSEDPQLQKEQKVRVKAAIASANNLATNIEDFLDYAQMTSGTFKLRLEETNLKKCLLGVKNNYNLVNTRSKVEIQLPKSIRNVLIDENRLSQIFVNILKGIDRYSESPNKGKTLHQIKVKHLKQTKDLLFMIKCHLPPNSLQQAIQMADKGYKEKEEEEVHSLLGLGLMITKMIVEKLNSDLKIIQDEESTKIKFILKDILLIGEEGDISSEEGEECLANETFLPIKPALFHTKSLTHIIPKRQNFTTEGNEEFINLPKVNISHKPFLAIIVDDSDMNRFVLRRIIEREYNLSRIKESVNGRESVELVQELLINHEAEQIIIFMDLDMPIMNGIQATKAIRILTPNIPIIVVTAYASDDDRTNSLRAGANQFLHKPLSAEKIKIAINLYIHNQQ